MRNVDVTAKGKLIVLSIMVLGLFGYIVVANITGNGDTGQAWAALTLIVGYLIGNGVGAARGQVTVPPLSPTPEKQLETVTKVLSQAIDDKRKAADDTNPGA